MYLARRLSYRAITKQSSEPNFPATGSRSFLLSLPSPPLHFFLFLSAINAEERRNEGGEGGEQKKEEGKVAKCPREVADPRLLSLLTPAGSAFNLRSSIGLLVRREQANGPVIETPLSRPST